MATITELIAGVTDPHERAIIKAREIIARRQDVAGTKFSYQNVSITIIDNPHWDPTGTCVEVNLSAVSKGKALPLSNPFRFFNPPINNITVEATYDANGNVITPRQVAEDTLITLRQMVGDAVLVSARSLGWTG